MGVRHVDVQLPVAGEVERGAVHALVGVSANLSEVAALDAGEARRRRAARVHVEIIRAEVVGEVEVLVPIPVEIGRGERQGPVRGGEPERSGIEPLEAASSEVVEHLRGAAVVGLVPGVVQEGEHAPVALVGGLGQVEDIDPAARVVLAAHGRADEHVQAPIRVRSNTVLA